MVGTGFAGAVTACRLTQARQTICVLERGRRYEADDLPVYPAPLPSREPGETSPDYVQPDFSRSFWKLGQGLWDVRDLSDVVVAQAAGYGGGSLIYANVHLRAPEEVFTHGWPEEYRRETLERYYDLAAYMLDVKPMPHGLDPPKRSRLRSAAQALRGSKDEPIVRHFDPPLAIRFPEPGTSPSRDDAARPNRWGRDQKTCDLRGDCCFGCPKRAKNTLDLNYLAIAEDTEERGGPAPDIRTLAEVVSIERVPAGGGRVFRVRYRDHLFGGREVSVLGKAVFLCAGAVNTTELLLRCRAAGTLEPSGSDLGKRYHANVDTLAAVFDGEPLQELDRGPTITGSLLYSRESDDPRRRARGDAAARDWLLVQDGGLPTPLAPLLGVFRSPLWARRNRYREGAKSQATKPEKPLYAELPFAHAVDVLSGLTRSAIRPGMAPALAIAEAMRMRREESRWPGEGPESLVPAQLDQALKATRRELRETWIAAVEPVVDSLLGDAAQKLEERYGALGNAIAGSASLEDAIAEYFPFEGIDLKDMGKYNLARRALRLGVQLIWRSEGGMAEDFVNLLRERLVPEGNVWIDRATDLLRWLLDYRLSDGHEALLLAMGRDSQPGEMVLCVEPLVPGSRIVGTTHDATATLLSAPLAESDAGSRAEDGGVLLLSGLQGQLKQSEGLAVDGRIVGTAASEPIELTAAPSGEALRTGIWALRFSTVGQEPETARLRVALPGRLEATEREVQERLLRDLAAEAWDGELRTDPLWTFLDRRVTVHSQGGCPMGGGTRPDGEVIGCDGLYVMDAAAFPTPVGVNPSATIAAVAEYKIEQYIRKQTGDDTWSAPELPEAIRWAEEATEAPDPGAGTQRIRRDALDPLRAIAEEEGRGPRAQSAPPRRSAVGIRFEETLQGFHSSSSAPPTRDVEPYRGAERRAAGTSARITARLRVEIADLARFLERHRAASRAEGSGCEYPSMAVAGTIEGSLGSGPAFCEDVASGSSIRFFDPMPGDGREERVMRYALHFALRGTPHVLEGEKYVRDDRSFDVWQDSVTLFFDLLREESTGRIPLRRGVLRQPVTEFLETQLPSFEATNTDDPARQGWALAAFGRYFFGNLADVYLPEKGRVLEVLKNTASRTHG